MIAAIMSEPMAERGAAMGVFQATVTYYINGREEVMSSKRLTTHAMVKLLTPDKADIARNAKVGDVVTSKVYLADISVCIKRIA